MWVWESYKVSIHWSTSALWYPLRQRKKSLRRNSIRSYDYCCATTVPAFSHLKFSSWRFSFRAISHVNEGCAPLECLNFSVLCFVWRLSVSQCYIKWRLTFFPPHSLPWEFLRILKKGTFLSKRIFLLSWGIFSIITFFPISFLPFIPWPFEFMTYEHMRVASRSQQQASKKEKYRKEKHPL